MKTFATFLSIFVFLSSSITSAQDHIQELFADTASSNNVLIVHTRLVDINGIQKPVIEQMVIQRGRSRLLQKEALQRRDTSIYQIEVLDSSNQSIFRMNFQYPRVMTVPMADPTSKQETIDDAPSQILIERPEATLVIPYLYNASFVRIFQPGQESAVVSMSMRESSVKETIYPENDTIPPPSQQGKFHLLIMASGYSPAELTAFNSRAQSVKNQFLSTEPFKSNSSKIEVNIYANTSDLGCFSGCFGIDRLMCCDDYSVISTAAASGYYYDEIIVIHNTGTYSGSGGRDYGSYKTNSYDTYCQIYDGEYSEVMALHEFGHSFGNLCDEYIYGDEGYEYYDCANCKASCSGWTGLTSECNKGCDARSSYFRPDDSIMLTLDILNFNNVCIQHSLIPRLSYFISGGSPDPDIKANGSDGSITPTDNLSVTVALDPGSRSGVNADWWVAADTPLGWFYLDAGTMSWAYAGVSYTDLSPAYQGQLFDLSTFEVLNMADLPVGTYTFYFAIDTSMNGSIDFDELFFDSVIVNVTP